jgi:hypothetical protein
MAATRHLLIPGLVLSLALPGCLTYAATTDDFNTTNFVSWGLADVAISTTIVAGMVKEDAPRSELFLGAVLSPLVFEALAFLVVHVAKGED